MTTLNGAFEYEEAEVGCIMVQDGAPDTEGAERDRLGDPAPLPPIAFAMKSGQVGGMKHRVLSLSERIELFAGLRAGQTQAMVAARLGRSAGAISAELRRNGGRRAYCPERAHRAAHERRSSVRRGHCQIGQTPPLRDEVHALLRRGWSPEEIAGSLRREHPDLVHMHTSHESIYRYVYVVARGELQRELAKCLRRGHPARKPRRRGEASAQGNIPDMMLVDERPAEVEDRLIAGHYEGDLIVGAGNRSAVGVLVERTTRFTMLCHLPQKDAQSVREAFTRRLASIPLALRKTLTYDQGKEMSQHKILSADLGLQVFFCHPRSPWERGTCESQNGRIRHYLPKGTDLSTVSYQQLSAYQEMLNERPRKILAWKSPAQCFHELLISNLPSN